MKKIIIGIAATLFVFVAGALICIRSGHYNVSTKNHDNALVNWAMATEMRRSVQTHAEGIKAPR
jgi:hypothetical protein